MVIGPGLMIPTVLALSVALHRAVHTRRWAVAAVCIYLFVSGLALIHIVSQNSINLRFDGDYMQLPLKRAMNGARTGAVFFRVK
jgi:hypothetical protein